MNPFDLKGPDFLVFYGVLCGGILLALAIWKETTDKRGSLSELPSDPYLIAYLRGGRAEALRTALLSLIRQGAVKLDDQILLATAGDPRRARVPLETELLAETQRPRAPRGLLDSGVASQACEEYQQRLEQLGYLRKPGAAARFAVARVVAAIILVGVAVVKIAVAIQRGRSNFGLLVLCAVVSVIAISQVRVSVMTGHGKWVLRAVRALLEDAQERIRTLGRAAGSEELLMVAAAYGLAALPAQLDPVVNALGVGSPTAGWGSVDPLGPGFLVGGGTSCGGIGGASCGSSCGGGGCGGGCGGCGS